MAERGGRVSRQAASKTTIPSDEVLSKRALNRALLSRQHLLERSNMSASQMIEHLVGMQAQVPNNPYVGLWSRLDSFQPEDLASLIIDRQAVRATLMRTTIHLVTARDCLKMRPLVQPIVEKLVYSDKTRGRAHLGDLDMDEVLAAGRSLMEEKPRSNTELRELLGARWPEHNPEALARAVRYILPVVQVPPRGVWGKSSQPRLDTVEHWLGKELDPNPSVDALILRYLAAFGPATTADMRTWSRLTGLREAVERLRPQLRTFRDESGKELFDVPNAPLPSPDTPAPPRFLPEFDNVLLSHADRTHIVRDEYRKRAVPTTGQPSVLIDGFVRGIWRVKKAKRSATMTIEFLEPVDQDGRTAVLDEAERVFEFVAGSVETREIEITEPD